MLGKLNNDQIEQLLRTQVVGRLGCHHDDKIYVVPITYIYDGQYIIGHTQEGMKIHMMRENPNVCFEIDKVDNMANWESVIAWGVYEELQGYDARLAMQKLINRMQPLMIDETNAPTQGMETHLLDTGGIKVVVYRIKILEKTGRFEKRTNMSNG
jgi:uncharacterized protein